MSRKIYPKEIGKCLMCKGPIIAMYSAMNKPNRKFCSYSCRTTYYDLLNNPSKRMTQEQKSKQKVAVSLANKGKEWTKESREKLSNSISGDKHWNWKGGVTPIHAQLRNNLDIKEWRRKVFEKDNYTCGICEVRGGYLQAHHILPFSIFPQFRLNVENGITLHKECHLKIKNKEFLYAPIFLGV